MRRSAPFLFLVLLLCIGCGPSRRQAHYGWLRKQGPRTAAITPEAPAKSNLADQARADAVTSADIAKHAVVVLEAPPPDAAAPVTDSLLALVTAPRDTIDRPDSIPQDTAYYAVQHHPWNAKAIASLPIAVATVVIGLATQSIYLLLIGGAISFALGLIASRQCRDRGDHGKGFAILAMVLGAAALFLSLMVLITAA